VDPGNVPPPNADGQRTFNDPALGFRGLERHRLDSRSKGTQAAGREAWRHLDAGTDDAIRRYEHTWWQFNICYTKKKDCPAVWLELLFVFWVQMCGATEFDIVLERSLDEKHKKGFKKRKRVSESLHGHAIFKMHAPTQAGIACRWLLKQWLCSHLVVEPKEVIQFLKPFGEMQDKSPTLMTAYQGKAKHMPGFRRKTSFSKKELAKGMAMLSALNSKPWNDRIAIHHNSKSQLVSNFKSVTLAPLGAEVPEPIALTLMIKARLFTPDKCWGIPSIAGRPNVQLSELLHKCWDHPEDWTVHDTLRLFYTWAEGSRDKRFEVDETILQQGPIRDLDGEILRRYSAIDQALLPEYYDSSVIGPVDYGVENRVNGMVRLQYPEGQGDGIIIHDVRAVSNSVTRFEHEVVVQRDFGQRDRAMGDRVLLEQNEDISEEYFTTEQLRHEGPLHTGNSRWFPQLDLSVEMVHHPVRVHEPHNSHDTIAAIVRPY
jgi:hypothetical protein